MCFFNLAFPNVTAGLTDVAYRTSAESTTDTVTIPATAEENDYAVLVDFGRSDPGTVVPTGWTQLYTDTAAGLWDITVSYKKLSASDPGATVTGANATPTDTKLMLVFDSGGRATHTINDASGNSTDGDPTSESTTTANSGTTPLIVIGISTGSAGSSFTTESPAFDATVAHTSGRISVGYKIYTSSPANHTVDKGDDGTGNTVHIHYVELGA